ncbi:hypothetical protein FRC01_008523 [Tulasnella sp. 417]|nr:hypothetical protein FRC01_008523 [Tulasnella sp. 417]
MFASNTPTTIHQSSTCLTHKPGHSSAVNRAFGIDEITRLIISFLSAREDFIATLLVCKSFHIPALDRLWEVIPNLSPLFRILPQDAIDFMVEKCHQGKLFYKHKLLNGRAKRVLKSYCRRIKQISALDLRDVDMRTVRAFVGSLGLPLTAGGQQRRVSDDLPCLFPNLVNVTISIDPLKPSHGDFLAHLYSPKLEELSIQLTPLHPLLTRWAPMGSSRRVRGFSAPRPPSAVPALNNAAMDTLEDDLATILEIKRPVKFLTSAQKAMEPEAPIIRRRSKIAKPISPTDDAEDPRLAPAFGEKAYTAAVSMNSPFHTMTIDISGSTDGGIMQLEFLCAIPSLRDVRIKGDMAPPTHAYAVLRYLGANPAIELLSSSPTPSMATPFAINNPRMTLDKTGWFPTLKSFQGYNASLTTIITSSPECLSNLTKIHITFGATNFLLDDQGMPPNQRLQIQGFFDLVGSRCHALEDVTVQAFWDIDGQEGPISLKGLSSCSGMRSLVFDGPDPSMNPPTDKDIIEVAEAWPLLEVLHWQGALIHRDGSEGRTSLGNYYASMSQVYAPDTRPYASPKSLAKLSQLCRHLKEIQVDVDCREDLGSDDFVEPLPELERITVWRWILTPRDVARTASVIAALAGPFNPESTLKKARDWIIGGASRLGAQKTKLWEEVFRKVDELRGVPEELRDEEMK